MHSKLHKLYKYQSTHLIRDSVIDIATRYELRGPGIESQWGKDFPHLSRPALGPTQPPIQWLPDFFPEGNACFRVKLTLILPPLIHTTMPIPVAELSKVRVCDHLLAGIAGSNPAGT